MPATPVLPHVVVEGTRHTASVPNPGTTSGGAVTFAVPRLSDADRADPGLSIVLTVQMQYAPGGDFASQPGAEYAWRGGRGQPLPTVSWRDPSYRRARCQIDVSRFVSLGVNASTP